MIPSGDDETLALSLSQSGSLPDQISIKNRKDTSTPWPDPAVALGVDRSDIPRSDIHIKVGVVSDSDPIGLSGRCSQEKECDAEDG